RHKGTACPIDMAEEPGAGINQPQAATVDARRVRHGEVRGDYPVIADVDHDSAIAAPLAPSVRHVAATDRGHIAGLAVLQSQTVEMTAILGGQLAQKGRPPEWRETVALMQGGQTAKLGV